MNSLLQALPAILALTVIATPSFAVTPSFVGMAEAGSEGSAPNVGSGVSLGGTTAVGYFSAGGSLRPMRWTPSGGMVHLADPGLIGTAEAVSPDGSVIVGYHRPVSAAEAFRWTGGVMTPLGDLPGGNNYSWAFDVSSDGSVVVGKSKSSSGDEAFIWTQGGGMVGLGDLPGGTFVSQARGVSGDGSVVVGSGNSGSSEAFRWTQSGGMVGLGDLPGGANESYAEDASNDGSVVVGVGDIIGGTSSEAFRWTQGGGMVGLGDLPGGAFMSQANAVSADGAIVVGYGTTATAFNAIVWDAANGMQSLPDLLTNTFGIDLTGWTLAQARAISPDGRTIAGSAEHAATTEPWVAHVPLPDEYEPVPAGPQTSDLEGGTATPGGLQISFDSLAGGTIIAQYLTETQAVLGQGIDLSEIEDAGFRVPGEKLQAWDITFVGALNPAGQVVAAFAYDELLLSSPEADLAVFHYPTGGAPMLICSPNSAINTCPELAVVDEISNTITITVDAIPSIDILSGPPPPMPALGLPALLSLSIFLMAGAFGVLRVRAAT